MSTAGSRVAVVLFNLGGPDGPDAVRPFLENLFSDPAIIGLPWLIRRPLAALIARRRRRQAIANYAIMGGGSPLLPETREQAQALEVRLAARRSGDEVKVFVAMRYWSPLSEETARAVEQFAPDEVVLAPLYPQYSTTTSASSLKAWREAYRGSGRVSTLCCWYDNGGLVAAHADRIREVWEGAGKPKVRLLFSAHGLPERVVAGGDPYQWQVEATCARVAAALGEGWDWKICYQSRVGPLRWLGPSTPEAIEEAIGEGLGVLVDPIAFVSDHVETLVELDHDYERLARERGVSVYLRAPVVGVTPVFVEGLAGAVERTLGRNGVGPDGAPCPATFGRCPYREGR
ncbi:MAG TPA: ferrochelatase [Caulobacteraceae bacterium]